jgi:hypothetical protein
MRRSRASFIQGRARPDLHRLPQGIDEHRRRGAEVEPPPEPFALRRPGLPPGARIARPALEYPEERRLVRRRPAAGLVTAVAARQGERRHAVGHRRGHRLPAAHARRVEIEVAGEQHRAEVLLVVERAHARVADGNVGRKVLRAAHQQPPCAGVAIQRLAHARAPMRVEQRRQGGAARHPDHRVVRQSHRRTRPRRGRDRDRNPPGVRPHLRCGQRRAPGRRRVRAGRKPQVDRPHRRERVGAEARHGVARVQRPEHRRVGPDEEHGLRLEAPHRLEQAEPAGTHRERDSRERHGERAGLRPGPAARVGGAGRRGARRAEPQRCARHHVLLRHEDLHLEPLLLQQAGVRERHPRRGVIAGGNRRRHHRDPAQLAAAVRAPARRRVRLEQPRSGLQREVHEPGPAQERKEAFAVVALPQRAPVDAVQQRDRGIERKFAAQAGSGGEHELGFVVGEIVEKGRREQRGGTAGRPLPAQGLEHWRAIGLRGGVHGFIEPVPARGVGRLLQHELQPVVEHRAVAEDLCLRGHGGLLR